MPESWMPAIEQLGPYMGLIAIIFFIQAGVILRSENRIFRTAALSVTGILQAIAACAALLINFKQDF